MLKNIWYFGVASGLFSPVGFSREICAQPVVFGRTVDGTAFALQDNCPHRGAPLSEGRIKGDQVECCYHGWMFGTDGKCTTIPALVDDDPVDLSKINVRSYSLREQQGIIWVWFGEGDGANVPIPKIPDVGDKPPQIVHALDFDVSIDHAVVGLIDPAHACPRSWWWRRPANGATRKSSFQLSARHDVASRVVQFRIYQLLGGAPQVEIAFALRYPD